ncbi:hypothetical protein M4I32_02375 [Microbacterium sp. LRZ72]|nr:hypothetical protein [Microbacterium sp. LRZ72]MDX2375643.1 hypothetical protein [Microbacterium sp. LRZ72]
MLRSKLGLHVSVGGEQFVERRRDALFHRLNGVGWEAFAGHDGHDVSLDLLDSDRRCRAEPTLFGGADEVLVRPAVAGVLAVEQAACAPGIVALTAIQHSLQVMGVDDVAVALPVALIQHFLHLQEGLLGNERIVASDVELAFVPIDARVVRIAEQRCESAVAHGSSGARRRRPGREALFLHQLRELTDRVSTGRVLLESPRYERPSFGVDIDRVDEATAEVLSDVEVPQLRSADRAALLNLVSHLHLDVLTVHADLDFVHDVGDGFHRVGHVAVAELFLRRDQPNTLLQEFAFGDRRICEVSKHARAHVDDDVLHFGVIVEVAQHLPELGALGDRLRGLPGFNELAGNCGVEVSYLAERLDALRRDAVAVLVDVGRRVELPGC